MLSTQHTLKDHFRETRLFNTRAIIAFVFSVLLIVMLISRLVYLQVVDHELYSTLSEDNRFHIAPIPPTRGLIFDRNGLLLAQNLPTYTLEIMPERVRDMEETLRALQQLIDISDSDLNRFQNQVKRSRPFKSIPIRTSLTDEEIARIAVNRHRHPGVDIAARLIRHYPNKGLAVHALGYVGRINEKEADTLDETDYDGTEFIGKTGVEKFYENTLHGEVGVQQVETNATGRSLRMIETVPSTPGLDLHLTLDAGLQAVAELAFGEEKGSLVALDPNDGSILALASVPTFDPNLFVSGIDFKTYKSLQDDPQIPLFNRALRGRYPPGSTVKPFVGLAGLETGVISADTKTVCPGWYRLRGDKHKYRDWKKTGHGKAVDIDKAVTQSCDVFFYDLAHNMGVDQLSTYMKGFGFNYKTDIDISGELAGLMPSRAWKKKNRNLPWYPGETLITGIGQGFTLITPLQLAVSTAALSLKGKRLQPHIVRALGTADIAKRHEIPSTELSSVPIVAEENWDRIIKAMVNVTSHWRGTAYRIGKDAKYKIAAKTGTAQVFSVKQDEEYKEEEVKKSLRDHALFIAFAPVKKPKIAVAVIVENGGHGGSVAGPIARKVMDYYLLDAETGELREGVIEPDESKIGAVKKSPKTGALSIKPVAGKPAT